MNVNKGLMYNSPELESMQISNVNKYACVEFTVQHLIVEPGTVNIQLVDIHFFRSWTVHDKDGHRTSSLCHPLVAMSM